jgi:hypothetical protein
MKHHRLSSLVLVSLLTACGSASAPSSDDAGGGDAPLSIDRACTDLAKARCTRLAACSDADLKLRDGDEATCETREKASCVNGLSAPATGSTPTTAEACASAIGAATCAQYLGFSPIAACAPKVGTLGDGASCTFSGQCASSFCAVPVGAGCGKCAAVPKVGDACHTEDSAQGCGPYLHCGKDSNLCVAYVASGGACDKNEVCDFGLSCVGAKTTTKGACQPLAAAVGATCDAKQQTAPGCDRALGLWCPSAGASAGKCAPFTTYAKTGEACGTLDDVTYAACSGGAVCVVPPGGAGKGTCQGPANAGEPCDTSGNGASCITGARCVVIGDAGTSGTCVVSTGDACK